jgi:hypothetical protein
MKWVSCVPSHAAVSRGNGSPEFLLEYIMSAFKLHRKLIYVYRRFNGADVPLLIENQRAYKEWVGCFSAI